MILSRTTSRCGSSAISRMPPIFAVCAVLSALLPIHPSMQPVWIALGVPSIVGVLMFIGPVFLFFLLRPVFSRYELGIFFPFFVYLAWMAITSLYSPAIGMPNWWNSIRSLEVILPAMLMAACIAARSPGAASSAVIGCGVAAGLHYAYLWGTGRAGGDVVGGFVAIAVIDGVANYQATAFYIGIVGVWALSLVEYQKRYLLTGISLFLLSVALISTAGARSSLVGLSIVAAIILGKSGPRRMAMIASIALVTLIVLGLAMSFVTEQPVGVMLQGLPVIERFLTLFEDGDSSHRLRLFASALEMWLDSPGNVFFGGGLASYPLFIGQADEAGWYPHNFILESLAEGGMVAVLILCVPLLRFASSFFRGFVIKNENLFLRNFALYSCSSYMFMGGIESVWIPLFALSLHLFATKLVARDLHDLQDMQPMCDGHFGPRDFVRRHRSL